MYGLQEGGRDFLVLVQLYVACGSPSTASHFYEQIIDVNAHGILVCMDIPLGALIIPISVVEIFL